MVSQAAVRRLRHAVAQHAAVQPRTNRHACVGDLPPIATIFRGDWHETPHGPVFVRDEWFPLDHRHGALRLDAGLNLSPEVLAHLAAAPGVVAPSRLAFFDIETTGLSAGTGTWVILAGLGSYEDGAFRLRQYFLADLADERAMLSMLAADFARFDGLVTYNGRAFDVPFVHTRMTLARIAQKWDSLAHLDLLHVVRRLFRHRMATGCSLAATERRLIRVERLDDVPGALIPSLYFDYVRAGRAAPLRGVFRHNAEDVLSLVGVMAVCARLLATDDLDPDDAIAAGRWWESAGQRERAVALYRSALPWLEGGDEWRCVAARQARLCKRLALRDEAVRLWRALWHAGDRAAGLELAKHYEHRARDVQAALEATALLQRGATDAERDALAGRATRLRRKLSRMASQSSRAR